MLMDQSPPAESGPDTTRPAAEALDDTRLMLVVMSHCQAHDLIK